MKENTFGINMKEFCRSHEAYIASHKASRELWEYHLEKLRWLQHERLVHLIVTLMVVLVEAFVLGLVLLAPQLGLVPVLMLLLLAILLGFYFFHYFFLENTVQRWYLLSDRIREEAGL